MACAANVGRLSMKVDKFVFCTDSHLANNQPVGRIDDFNAAMMRKWKFVVKECNRRKVQGLICGGDLCHTYRTSDELYVRFVKIMSELECPFYYLYGNHDIQAGNANYIDNTNMGMLAQYHWFNPLDVKRPYEFNHTILTGTNYTRANEVKEFYGWNDSQNRDIQAVGNEKLSILVTHAMITNGTLVIKGDKKSIDVEEVETDADVLLNGHYHVGHPRAVKNEALERTFYIANPGSMARMNLAEARDTYGPRMIVITVKPKKSVKFDFVEIPHKPYNEVFDVQAHHAKKAEMTARTNFASVLESVRSSCAGLDITASKGFNKAVKAACKALDVKLTKEQRAIMEGLKDEH